MDQKSTRKYCNKVVQLPSQAHYAIIRSDSAYIPGDERSRTNPGHGYPERTLHHLSYESYTNKDEWVAAIQKLEEQKDVMYRAFRVVPAEITSVTTVQVG